MSDQNKGKGKAKGTGRIKAPGRRLTIIPQHTSTSSASPSITPQPLGPPEETPSMARQTSHQIGSQPQVSALNTCASAAAHSNGAPVPSSTSTLNVAETQCSGNKSIFYIRGEGFLPSHPAANAISDIFKGHFLGPWDTWRAIPKEEREWYFEEFLRKYVIVPHDEYEARKIFEKRGAILLKNILQKWRKKGERPNWISESAWDGLHAKWQGDDFKKRSHTAKTNRASDCGGFGQSKHTGGSITTSQHRDNLTRQNNGVPPSAVDLFRRTHQRKDQSWVDQRSAHIADKFEQVMEQRTQTSTEEGASLPDELDVWREVAGESRGKIYGLGLESTAIGRPRYRGSSSISSELVRREEHEEQAEQIKTLTTENTELRGRLATTEQRHDKFVRFFLRRMNIDQQAFQLEMQAMEEAEEGGQTEAEVEAEAEDGDQHEHMED